MRPATVKAVRPAEERPAGHRPGPALAGWIAVVLAGLYPLIEAIRLIVDSRPTVRFGDTALLDLSAARASHFDQLVGPYSRDGFHHPGPVSFYITAPFLRALGSGQGDYLADIIVAGVCMVAIAALLWRWTNSTVALWGVAALAVWILCLHPFTLREPWNPYQVVAPMALLAVLVACAATGRRGTWVWALVVGSYAAQTHVATGITVAVLLLVPVAPVALRLRQHRSRPGRPPAGAVIGWVCFALAWLPVLIELFADKPNNLRLLWDFYGHSHAEPPLHQALTTAADALAIIPFGNTDYTLAINRPDWQLVVVLLGLVLLAVVTLALAWLRRQPFAAACVAGAAVLALVGTLSLTRASGGVSAYFVTWMADAPLLVLLGLGVGLLGPPGPVRQTDRAPAPAHRRSRSSGPTLVPVALVGLLTVAGVALTVRSDLDMQPASKAIIGPQVATAQFAREIEARHPRGTVALDLESHDAWPFAAGVVLELYRHHIRSTVSPASWVLLFGKQDRPDQPSTVTYCFYTTAGAQADRISPSSILSSSDGAVLAAGPPPAGVVADGGPP